MLVLAFAESVQIMPDFALVVHVVFILVMIWVLNRTFFRPINKVIASRESGKGGRLSESEQILQLAAEKEQTYKDELLESRNKGYELIEIERTSAIEQRQQNVSTAKAEIETKKSQDLEELSKHTESIRKEIDTTAEKLADQISSNIIKAA